MTESFPVLDPTGSEEKGKDRGVAAAAAAEGEEKVQAIGVFR